MVTIAEVPHPHGRVVAITKHQLSEVALRLKFSFRVVDTVYLQESAMANYRYMSGRTFTCVGGIKEQSDGVVHAIEILRLTRTAVLTVKMILIDN